MIEENQEPIAADATSFGQSKLVSLSLQSDRKRQRRQKLTKNY